MLLLIVSFLSRQKRTSDFRFKSRKRRVDAVLAIRNFQQLIGMQLCPIPQQQWLATQNVLCIVCDASDVRHSSVLDLAEQFDSSLCVRWFERCTRRQRHFFQEAFVVTDRK